MANRPKKKPPHRSTLPAPPSSWKAMQKHPRTRQFQAAAQKEWDALVVKKTFEVVPISKMEGEASKESPIPLMWVFTYKFDDEGYLIKEKARLVARGDLQFTQEETYAATLAAQIFRVFIAIVAIFGLYTRQYNAVNAFANAKNRTPVLGYMPEGYYKPGFILWILNALYRLKTLPLYWYQEFTATLEELGLSPILGTNCIFKNDWLILIFYVDDIIVAYHP